MPFFFQNLFPTVTVGNGATQRCVHRIRTYFFFWNPTFFGVFEKNNVSAIGNVFIPVDISKFVKNEKIYRDISRYSAIYQDISRYIAIYPELIYFDMSILRYITIYWRKIYPNFWYILINSDISPKNDICIISIYHDG